MTYCYVILLLWQANFSSLGLRKYFYSILNKCPPPFCKRLLHSKCKVKGLYLTLWLCNRNMSHTGSEAPGSTSGPSTPRTCSCVCWGRSATSSHSVEMISLSLSALSKGHSTLSQYEMRTKPNKACMLLGVWERTFYSINPQCVSGICAYQINHNISTNIFISFFRVIP